MSERPTGQGGWFTQADPRVSSTGWQFGQSGQAASNTQPTEVSGMAGTPRLEEDRMVVCASNNGEVPLIRGPAAAADSVCFFTVAGNPRSERLLLAILGLAERRGLNNIVTMVFQPGDRMGVVEMSVGLFDQVFPGTKHTTFYAPRLLVAGGKIPHTWPTTYSRWPDWVETMQWAVGVGESVADAHDISSCAGNLLANFSKKHFNRTRPTGIKKEIQQTPWGTHVAALQFPGAEHKRVLTEPLFRPQDSGLWVEA